MQVCQLKDQYHSNELGDTRQDGYQSHQATRIQMWESRFIYLVMCMFLSVRAYMNSVAS